MTAPSSARRFYILMEDGGLGSTFSLPRWIHCGIFVIFFLSICPSSFSSDGDFSTTAIPPTATPTPTAQPFPHLKSGSRFESRVRTPLIAAASSLLFALLLVMGIFKFLSVRHRVRSSNRVVVGDKNAAAAAATTADEKLAPPVVCEYSWEQIQKMTSRFKTMVGVGGFSKVYLARISGGGGLAAVKVHMGSERLNLAFKQELDVLLHIRHENIVKLIGFCNDQGEGALVFEYMPNGNLQEKLHNHTQTKLTEPGLSWKTRMQIAFQLARAIHYLHEQCSLQIVHGDIKSSNILLDKTLNCKLCDFGTAKMGFSSTVLPPSASSNSPRTKHLMTGSPGYTDPHYVRTGIASKKNDIYSFGVIILELITGMEAFCPQKGQILASMPALKESDEAVVVEEIVDRKLNGEYPIDEFKVMFCLARNCLQQSPTSRPSASDILETFSEKVGSIGFGSESSLKGEEINLGVDK